MNRNPVLVNRNPILLVEASPEMLEHPILKGLLLGAFIIKIPRLEVLYKGPMPYILSETPILLNVGAPYGGILPQLEMNNFEVFDGRIASARVPPPSPKSKP